MTSILYFELRSVWGHLLQNIYNKDEWMVKSRWWEVESIQSWLFTPACTLHLNTEILHEEPTHFTSYRQRCTYCLVSTVNFTSLVVHVNYELNERDIPETGIVCIHGVYSISLLQAAEGCAVVNALQELTQDGCLLRGIVIKGLAIDNITYTCKNEGWNLSLLPSSNAKYKLPTWLFQHCNTRQPSVGKF